MAIIVESDMRFGEFDEERLFVIEHSDVHKKAGKGIKTVEFIYLTENDNLLFIEAKQSCPNEANKDETEEKQIKYEEYFSDITDKFVDSLNMFAASALGRNHECYNAGAVLKEKNTYENIGLKLILVINNAEDSWLQGPKIELEQRLLRFRKIWRADILVLNKKMAKEYGLIS